jgi:ABC-type transporter Mla MlaB component
MPLHVSYIAQENRLDLSFHGNLDLSVSQDVCDMCQQVPADLRCCIIDLTDIRRLFDSGIALLQRLHRRLGEIGAIVVILSDHPEVRQWFPTITRKPLCRLPEQPQLAFGAPIGGKATFSCGGVD